jgi:hypothetical protein
LAQKLLVFHIRNILECALPVGIEYQSLVMLGLR